MHRFYIAPENWNAHPPTLTGPEAHHARDVLRVERGNRIVLFDGEGREMTAEVTDVAPAGVQLRKLHEARTPALRCRITLAQAIPKGKNMDLIVQKAVEIGASEIAPLVSDRTVVRLDGADDAAQKQRKWRTVAIEAAKQCGQNWLPQVHPPRRVGEFFNETPRHDLRLIGSLQPDALHLKKILADYAAEHRERPSSVLVVVGPEGDFSPAELNLARSNGCRPITLGPIVLRVETAAIYCLSVLSYELLV